MSYWNVLGLEPTTNKKVIKQAYAKLLKLHKPEQDPQGYQRLREAFDEAIKYCKADRQTINRSSIGQEKQAPNQSIIEQVRDSTNSDQNTVPQSDEGHHDHLIQQQLIKQRELQAAQIRQQQVEEQRTQQLEKEQWLSQQLEAEHQHHKEQLEQQRQQQLEKEQKAQKSVQLLEAKRDEVFSFGSADESINAFSVQLESDILLTIKYRQIFEQMCFRTGVEWDNQQEFPSKLFAHIAETFGWDETDSGDPYFEQHIGFLKGRIEAGLEYQDLRSLSNKRTFLSKQSHATSAARILLGKFRPRYFRFLAFFNLHRSEIVRIIDKFTKTYSIELCPEINTDTFQWWQKLQKSHQYSFVHLIFGIFVIPLILDNIDASTNTPLLIAALALSTIAVSVLAWLVLWLTSHGWSGIKVFYVNSWQNWRQRPLVYVPFALLYTFTFISKGWFIIDLSLIGWMLIFLVFGARAVFILPAAIAFLITQSMIETNPLPIFLDNLYVFAGIGAHLGWISLSRHSDAKVVEILNDGFATMLFVHIIIAASLGFVVFNALKFIL